MAQYSFTSSQDWFSFNEETWKSLFPLVNAEHPRALEIGSWEGRSAVFLATQLCKNQGEVVCIDHFDLMKTSAGRERHVKVAHNLAVTGSPHRILAEFSVPALMSLLHEEMAKTNPGFDWVYIDGSHDADDTLLDGELAWRLARRGAVFIFDDYNWDKEPESSRHHPRRGIDAFLALHEAEYQKLSGPDQYQMIVQKKTDMRIGFLAKDQTCGDLAGALEYGMNVVLTVDSHYAFAAAVVMRSLTECTSGRVTLYVVDCGMSEDDRAGLVSTLPGCDAVTLNFLELPNESMAAKHGAQWAKVDMLAVLPVERILYLDSDVLVRANLYDLWKIDLQGRPIGAVADIGFPMGHDEAARRPYFNAGVLLLDLAKIRLDLGRVHTLSVELEGSRFQDQDVLNKCFTSDWLPLDLSWNAQGLGTYADKYSLDRDGIDKAGQAEPKIVHFTGPVHPGMAEVLDPYNQPYTAKPWGYAGAPGHPFAEEWWQALDRTPWKGLRESDSRRNRSEQKKKETIEQGVQHFETVLERAVAC